MAAPRKYPLELREHAVRMYRATRPNPQVKRLSIGLGVHPDEWTEARRRMSHLTKTRTRPNKSQTNESTIATELTA